MSNSRFFCTPRSEALLARMPINPGLVEVDFHIENVRWLAEIRIHSQNRPNTKVSLDCQAESYKHDAKQVFNHL